MYIKYDLLYVQDTYILQNDALLIIQLALRLGRPDANANLTLTLLCILDLTER